MRPRRLAPTETPNRQLAPACAVILRIARGDLAGLAEHIGARIGARAEPGEMLVSSTVNDLVIGSGPRFADHGTSCDTDWSRLSAVPGSWCAALDSGRWFLRACSRGRPNSCMSQ
jgi:hypothetical protein